MATASIRAATQDDWASIVEVINEASQTYVGTIPDELCKVPYISSEEFASECRLGVRFTVEEERGEIRGVMGVQRRRDVWLIRHSYVRSSHQRKGIGGRLLRHQLKQVDGPVLVGCLAAMPWAITFYQSYGFRILPPDLILPVRRAYWTLSEAHIRQSVVLGNGAWFRERQVREESGSAPYAVLDPAKQTELALQYIALIYSQINHHKDVRDRWVRYYLIVIGIPIALLSSGIQARGIRAVVTDPYPILAGFAALLLVLGILFFLIYVKQRANYLAMYSRVMELEKRVIFSNVGGGMALGHTMMGQFNADLYANGLHVVLNSVWAALAVVFLTKTPVFASASATLGDWKIGGATFLTSILLHATTRWTMLARAERALRATFDGGKIVQSAAGSLRRRRGDPIRTPNLA